MKKTTQTQNPTKGQQVQIPFDLTTDPVNKQGHIGTITNVDSEGIVTVEFGDGTIGRYLEGIVEPIDYKKILEEKRAYFRKNNYFGTTRH